MSAAGSTPPPAISVDQWIALNQEIAALVRAGVPLEQGLTDLASDLPGRLGRFSAKVAEHLRQGEPLVDVLAREGGNLPPLYRAVVTAGVRSGRLPAALEALAGVSQRLADARRALTSAFVYPLLVVLLAWGLLIFYVLVLAPNVAPALRSFHAPAAAMLTGLAQWGASARYWAAVPPLVILLLAGLWHFFSSRPAANLTWVPWLGRAVGWLRAAAFADVLAMLVDSRVPLDQALELAGDASGDERLGRTARDMAEGVRRGEPLGASACAGALPPMLRWLVAAGQSRGTLSTALRHAAETYRSRAVHRATLTRTVLPTVLTVFLGGAVTAAFGLLVFTPWISMIHKLAGM